MPQLLQKLAAMEPEDVLIQEPTLEELFMQYYEDDSETDPAEASFAQEGKE